MNSKNKNILDDIVKVSIKCTVCGKVHKICVTKRQYDEYLHSNKHIQDVFTDLAPELREMFISQTCPKCWDKLFNFEDNDEEDY